MPKSKVSCRRKCVKDCKRAYVSCKYVRTKKSRFCRRTQRKIRS